MKISFLCVLICIFLAISNAYMLGVGGESEFITAVRWFIVVVSNLSIAVNSMTIGMEIIEIGRGKQ